MHWCVLSNSGYQRIRGGQLSVALNCSKASYNPDTEEGLSLVAATQTPLRAASIDFQPGRSRRPGGRCGAGQKCIEPLLTLLRLCGPAGQKLTEPASSFGATCQKGVSSSRLYAVHYWCWYGVEEADTSTERALQRPTSHCSDLHNSCPIIVGIICRSLKKIIKFSRVLSRTNKFVCTCVRAHAFHFMN